ncbi:MAG: hypothetical protein ABIH00_04910 [Armatimonadota bacterium]
MNKKLVFVLSVLILTAMLTSFLQAENIKNHEIFPMGKGSYWVYKLSNLVQVRAESLGTEKIEDRTYNVILSYPTTDYKNLEKEYYLMLPDGIYYYGNKTSNLNMIYTPLLKKLPAEIKTPLSWEWSGTISNIKSNITLTLTGPEDYTYKETKYPAYKLTQTIREASQKDPTKKIVITEWYVKGIGKVKEVTEAIIGDKSDSFTAELDIYSIK